MMNFGYALADQKKCLILFAAGGLYCVLLDLIGVGSAVSARLFRTPMDFPLPDVIVLPLFYTAAGIIVGLLAKRVFEALSFGACFGQCQFLLPLILYYFILHSGMKEQAWARAVCGIPLTPIFAWGSFSVKDSIKRYLKKRRTEDKYEDEDDPDEKNAGKL